MKNSKNYYLIKAIQNLIIKNNFLELSIKLAEKQITNKEFDNEIDQHPEKYIIEISYVKDSNDLFIINDILKEIKFKLSIDEVGDLFSLDLCDIEKIIKKI